MPLRASLYNGTPFDFHRRNHRRRLHLIAHKGGGVFVKLVQRHQRHGQGAGQFAVGIVAVGGLAEFDGAFIDLVVGHHFFGQLRAAAEHDDEQAGGVGIERAAMADLFDAKLAADGIHHVMRGRPGGLVKMVRVSFFRKMPHAKYLFQQRLYQKLW